MESRAFGSGTPLSYPHTSFWSNRKQGRSLLEPSRGFWSGFRRLWRNPIAFILRILTSPGLSRPLAVETPDRKLPGQEEGGLGTFQRVIVLTIVPAGLSYFSSYPEGQKLETPAGQCLEIKDSAPNHSPTHPSHSMGSTVLTHLLSFLWVLPQVLRRLLKNLPPPKKKYV